MRRSNSLFRYLALSALAASAAAGCSHDEGPAPATGSDDLVAAIAYNQAVVGPDSIELPAALVPAKVLRKIDAYRAHVTPKTVARERRGVRGRAERDEVIDMNDLLAQEQAWGGEKVILQGDRQDAVRPGEIIDEGSAGNPFGYLRRALSYERKGDAIVVRTAPATLAEYFGELEVGQEVIGGPPGPDGVGVRREPLKIPFKFDLVDVENRELFARRGHFESKAGEADGEVALRLERALLQIDGEVDLGVKVGFFKLKEAHLKLSGNVLGDLAVEAIADGNFKVDTGDVKLLKRPVRLALPKAGPLPLTAQIDLTARCTVAARGRARATFGAHLDAGAAVGFEFSKGELRNVGESPSFNFEITPPTFEVEAQGNARCAVEPTIEVFLFDAIGPQIGVEAFADARTRLAPPAAGRAAPRAVANVRTGLNFLVGGELKAPLFDFTLIDFGDVNVLSLESEPARFVNRLPAPAPAPAAPLALDD
jgi:hypothetical protein